MNSRRRDIRAQQTFWPEVAPTPPAPAYFPCRAGCQWPDGTPVYLTPQPGDGWSCDACGCVWHMSPTRLRVHDAALEGLRRTGCVPSCAALARAVGVSPPRVHAHLQRLREDGLIPSCPTCGRPYLTERIPV